MVRRSHPGRSAARRTAAAGALRHGGRQNPAARLCGAGIGLITEKGVLGLGRSAVVFAPRSFGSTAYEALYGNDFL